MLPFYFNNNGISILVTPLNVLGTQMEKDLSKHGISAINLTGQGQLEHTGSAFEVSKIILCKTYCKKNF